MQVVQEIWEFLDLISHKNCEILKHEIPKTLNAQRSRFDLSNRKQQGGIENIIITNILSETLPVINAKLKQESFHSIFKYVEPKLLTLTEYKSGGFIELHRDCSRTSSAMHTLLIYVNDNYEGGETLLYPDLIDIVPREQLFFTSPDTEKKILEATPQVIHPEKGKGLVFNVQIPHMSAKCTGYKYLVGSKLVS